MKRKEIHLLSLIIAISLNHTSIRAQESTFKKWSGSVINTISQTAIPHATVASYSQVALYIANEAGEFLLSLPNNDSLRITALGYESQTVHLQKAEKDSTGRVIIRLTPISYQIKEVTIKGYKGIFDPLIFQKHLPEEELIQLNLPSYIGSRISKLPPNERALIGKPSIGMILNPASLAYSLFSKKESSIRTLADAKANEIKLNHRDIVASKEIIAAISGFEGQELDDFLIYCNINLKIHPSDTGISASRKIENLLLQYKQK
ncbi:MAG TPA: carboxypeptidase-like regulatory domain-containing protein [Marinilabiliaceae bacterium]|nr:carboxypeptidase-like regulatory domain-containing protein [Marinilabiliaceae bacterium]